MLLVGRAAVRAVRGPFPSWSRSLSQENKGALKRRLLQAKAASGTTYNEIAEKTGLTNAYVAQLFHRQAQLKKESAAALQQAVPTLTEEDIECMREIPDRSFDPLIVQEPTVYRLQEAVLHYGEAIKALVNEKFGDGIMSAIDMYVTVDKVKGRLGEDRVVINLNGKFLPHIEQRRADNTVVVKQTGGPEGEGGKKKRKSTKAKKEEAR